MPASLCECTLLLMGYTSYLYVQVSKEKKGRAVDARCRDLTSTAACEAGRADPGSVPLCDWHEVRTTEPSWSRISSSIGQGLNDLEPGHLIPSGIWTLADIMERGKASQTCPYFTIRRMVAPRFFQEAQTLKRTYFRCHSSTSLSTRSTIY